MPRQRKNRKMDSPKRPAEAPPAAPEKPKRRWLPLAILLGVAFLTYANALRDGFVADDNLQILRNPYITVDRDVAKLFTTDVWGFSTPVPGNYYRPLQMLLYMGEYEAFGARPWAWHLFNLFVNLAAIAAAYFLVAALADASLAFWACLFFALQPMHVEAVVWVAALADLLCGFFMFLALLAYHRAREGFRPAVFYGFSALAFFAATLSKETSLMFPLILVAYEFFYRREPLTRLWRMFRVLVPYAAAIIIYLAMRLSVLGAFAPGKDPATLLSLGKLACAAPVLAARYLGKLLLPLHFNYWYAAPPYTRPGMAVIASIGLIVVIMAAMLALRKKQPLLTFSLAWFFIILAPVLDINNVGQNYFAERYLYIPSLGIAICFGMAWLWLRNKASRASWRIAAWSALGLLLAFHVAQIERRIPVFHDDLRLLRTTLPDSPRSPNVLASLASAEHEAGNVEGSIYYGLQAVALKPNYVMAQINLGNSFVEAGRYDEGLRHLQIAVLLQPDSTSALLSLAKAYVGAHDWIEAERCYNRAAQLDPTKAGYYEHLASLAATGEQMQEEITRLRDVVALHPESLDAWNQLGRAYAKLGQWDDSIACFRQILKREPGNVPTLVELAAAAQAKGDFAAAIDAGQEALSTQPGNSGVRMNLASSYYGAGRYDDSIALLLDLLRRDPNWEHADQVHLTLGFDYEKKSEWTAAAEQYRQALQLNAHLTPAQVRLDAIQSQVPSR